MQTAQKVFHPPSHVDKKAADQERDRLLSSLLIATARGDREAFARLYRYTSPRLFAIALRIVRRRELAEDVLQEAFLCIWNRAGSQRHATSAAYAWMVAVVRHRAIDAVRRERASREVSTDDEPSGEGLDELDAQRLMKAAVSTGLNGLPEKHRRALLYIFYYGLTHQELADTLQVPLGTAKSWVRRGLLGLKARFER